MVAVVWVFATCCLLEIYIRFIVGFCLLYQNDNGSKIELKLFFILPVELHTTRL